MRLDTHLLCWTCLFAAPLTIASAQSTLWTEEGNQANELLGQTVVGVGDLNLDGIEDIAVGSPEQDSFRGAVRIFSGSDGATLYSNVGTGGFSGFGASIAGVGDLNGDGYPEVLIGSPLEPSNDGRVRLLNGIHVVDPFQPAILVTFTPTAFNESLGEAVASIGDVNGDGIGDLAVGSPTYPGTGRVTVYSGLDAAAGVLTTLYVVPGNPSSLFGSSLAPLNDVDGDLVPDFVVGSPGDSCNLGAGRLQVVSGATGAFAMIPGNSICGATAGSQLGFSLATGDVDGDGMLDIIAGAPTAPNGGRVEVVSLAGPSFLARIDGSVANEGFGSSVNAGGDFNADGMVDILVGLTGPTGPASGSVRLFSGARLSNSSSSSLDFLAADWGSGTGRPSAAILVPSLDGDASAECVLGSPDQTIGANARAGRVSVVRGGRFPAGSTFCFGDGGDQMGCTSCPCTNDAAMGTMGGCLNSAMMSAALRAYGSPRVANDSLRFEVAGATPITFGVLVSAVNQLPNAGPCPAGSGIASFDGLRCVGSELLRHGTRATDANGDIGIGNNGWGPPDGPVGGIIASSGFTAGQTRQFQCFYREDLQAGCNTGQNTTNGVSLTLR